MVEAALKTLMGKRLSPRPLTRRFEVLPRQKLRR
jgi:hypothetical protein